MSPHSHRPPVSTRHAFALAFDLAVRRDPVHSIVVPLLIRSPFFLAAGLLAAPDGERPHPLAYAVVSIGFPFTTWTVDAMLRFRARSVFNRPGDAQPDAVIACYRHAVGRLPWLYLTEFVRNVAVAFGMGFFAVQGAGPLIAVASAVPGIWLGYKLGFATEAVVLDEPHLAAAFQRSWHLSRGRFERWLEMIVISVAVALGVFFVAATAVWALQPHIPTLTWALVSFVAPLACFPIIQYAWTFFYLRVVEADAEDTQPAGWHEPAGELPLPPRREATGGE